MTRFVAAVAIAFFSTGRSALPDENTARAIVDKGIAALGGEEKLANARIITWKSSVTTSFDDNKGRMSVVTTVRGIDQFRLDVEGESNGIKFEATTVVNGQKGWRSFGDFRSEMDADALADEKRGIYRAVAAATLIPIKSKGFKVVTAGEESVGKISAVGIQVTAPDGKTFKLFFDKESGLPIMQAAIDKIKDEDVAVETIFSRYKEFAGIKRATKIECKIGGKISMSEEITDFQVLDSVPEKFPE